MIALTREPIDHAALTEQVRGPHCGAVVTFLGTVRDLTGDTLTVALDYEAYPGMAEKKLAEIEADVRGRWPVGDLALVPPAWAAGRWRSKRGGRRELPAPGRRLRGLPSRNRPSQGAGPDLEDASTGPTAARNGSIHREW